MKLTQIALACLLSLTFGMTAVAQDDAADIEAAAAAIADDIDRDGERCISVTRLRSTHVLDDRTLLFYMRGGDIYLNVLRYECRGLKIQNRFSYKVTANRLFDGCFNIFELVSLWSFNFVNGDFCAFLLK